MTSTADIKASRNFELSESRYFDYSDSFVIFIKEREENIPYFALKVDNTDILVSAEQ